MHFRVMRLALLGTSPEILPEEIGLGKWLGWALRRTEEFLRLRRPWRGRFIECSSLVCRAEMGVTETRAAPSARLSPGHRCQRNWSDPWLCKGEPNQHQFWQHYAGQGRNANSDF